MSTINLADRIGCTHAGGKYFPGEGSFLLGGAQEILTVGCRVLKLWFASKSAALYPFDRWPATKTMLELAQTPAFRAVFDMPFTTFALEAFAFGVGGSGDAGEGYWVRGITAEQEREEARQFEDLTRHLLTEYAGTGKTFVLQNWEGDWAARGHVKREVDPNPAALDNMVRWLAARQAGVEKARREVGETGATVLHAAEVNLVERSLDGHPSVTREVLPRAGCDLSSYSAWDTTAESEGERYLEALDHIEEHTPSSPLVTGRKVMVGEFGCPENAFGTETAVRRVQRTLDQSLAWGSPYVIYWEVYDNEAKEGRSDEPGDCPGFWLVKPSGAHSPLRDLFVRATAEPAKVMA